MRFLLLSFGGPEAPEQVMPFLENVTRGRGIPRERLAAVAEHYLHFGGVSPINGINRALIDQLEAELADRGLDLPVYFGNRNWEPYVEDTVAAMRDNGIRRAAVFTTSAWGGYSSCTQYIEDIARGRAAAGDGAPELVKLRQYFDHPLFVEMFAEAIADAAPSLPAELRDDARLVFTAHSIPLAARSRCGTDLYARQVAYASRLVATRGGVRRLRPGVAVAIGAAAGAVAGTRCGRPSLGPRRSGHQGGHRLSDRIRRRPHRGGVGSGQRAACSRRSIAASHSPGPPPPMPTAASPGSRST